MALRACRDSGSSITKQKKKNKKWGSRDGGGKVGCKIGLLPPPAAKHHHLHCPRRAGGSSCTKLSGEAINKSLTASMGNQILRDPLTC